MQKNYHYYVEGPVEKAFIDALRDCSCRKIVSGKTTVLNVVQEIIPDSMLRTLNPNTVVILVFDTDTASTVILNQNIARLKKHRHVSDVYCIPQVLNFEDELVNCTSLVSVMEFTKSKSINEFKTAFLREKNILTKLIQYDFRIQDLWNRKPSGAFKDVHNDSSRIKKIH